MTTILYCADRELQIVSGAPRRDGLFLSAAHREALPEGVIRDGKILDELEFKGTLLSLRERRLLPRGGVELVLSPAAVETRRISAPRMAERKLRQLAKNEFLGGAEHICDYAVLARGSGGDVLLCGGVETELLDGYREAFCAAGISLRRADGAPGALARFAQWCFPEETLCLGVLEQEFCYLLQLRGGVFSSAKLYRGTEPREALRDFAEPESRVLLCGADEGRACDAALMEWGAGAGLRLSRLELPARVESENPEGRSPALICAIAALIREGVRRDG